MDVGSEISNKIRSAIKAKLVELDAYVDEELPDYIMVMVANKKSQLQMADDLGLFLAGNTEKFTTWLHGLLQKLQSITSDPTAILGSALSGSKTEKSSEKSKSKEPSTGEGSSKHIKHIEKHIDGDGKHKKRTSSDDGIEHKKEGKKRKSDGQEKKSKTIDDSKSKQMSENVDDTTADIIVLSDSVTDTVAIQDTATSELESNTACEKNDSDTDKDALESKKTENQTVKDIEVVLDIESKETDSETEQQKERTVEIERSDSISIQTNNTLKSDVSDIQVAEDDDLTELLLTENDELAEELEQETAIVLPTKKTDSGKAALSNVNDDEFNTQPKRGTSLVISSDSFKDNSPPRSSRARVLTSPTRQTSRRSAIVRAVERSRPLELLTRKRRGPVSVVGSVTHDTEEEEGYDPRNPAVGNVASVIKVTARKSSIPPKLQANKSLLLKAMTEAEKSVEKQRRVAITPVRPFMRSEGRDRDGVRDRERDLVRDRERDTVRDRERDIVRERERDSVRERDRDIVRERDRDVLRDRERDLVRDRERDGVRERDRDRGSHSLSSSRDSRRHSPPARLAQTSLRDAISQHRSSRHSPPEYIPTRKVQPAPRLETSDKVGIVSKSRRQEAEDRAWRDREQESALPRKSVRAEKTMPIVNFIIEAGREEDGGMVDLTEVSSVTVKQEPVSPQKLNSDLPAKSVRKLEAEIDSRVVEYEPEMVASPAKSISECGSQGVPALLEDMDHEQFLLDQDVLDLTEPSNSNQGLSLGPPLEEDQRQALIKDKTKDKTRFVVTLDGVDTDHYQAEAMETEDVVHEMAVDKAQPAQISTPTSVPPYVPKEPAQMLITPPKIKPLNISLKDSDEEAEPMEAEVAPVKKAKLMERCRFWPACANGAACDFHHPTTHCKTFPLCKFGDKCLYIHPNCRFDSKCMRPDCPYTHSGVRAAPPFPPPFVKPVFRPPAPVMPVRMTPPQCRFFPKCSNVSCPFFHPKPCRFGLNCKNKGQGCPFYHPPLPTVDKLTWVASKDPLMSAVGAGLEAKKVN